LAELVEHGRNGLLFEPGDAAALAAAMQYLLDHPDFRRQIEGAALVAAEAFKANRVVPKIERIYREAIAGLPLSRSAFPADAPPQTL
jgi:glycosyltransferase involved in cell wall biosynthesis